MNKLLSTPSMDSPDPEIQAFFKGRHRQATLWQVIFNLSTLVGIIVLVILLVTILNRTMGFTAVENEIAPQSLSDRPMDELEINEMAAIIRGQLTRNRMRTIERAGPLEEQGRGKVYEILIEEVVQPKVVQSYTLIDSLTKRGQISAEIAEKFPQATMEFRFWLNARFLQNAMASEPTLAGVRSALLGSFFLIVITISVAFPIGIGAAIYLEEYAVTKNWINRIIQTNIDNLAGVPSIVYGILGLAVFVRILAPFTSGAMFGVEGGSGRTILSAGLTMALLILPILIINAQEAIRAVPNSLRQASYGLGATRWQTIWNHVLPYALPGILTGTILAVSRAIGETAPLIVVGASTFITSDPSGPFSSFSALPIQIFNWTTRPDDAFRNIAAAAIVVLLVSLLTLNAVAIILRNRFTKRI